MHDKALTQSLMKQFYPKREAQIRKEYTSDGKPVAPVGNKEEVALRQPTKHR